jgi:hypothetical protein
MEKNEEKRWDSFCGLLFNTIEERDEHEKNCAYCSQYFSMDEEID